MLRTDPQIPQTVTGLPEEIRVLVAALEDGTPEPVVTGAEGAVLRERLAAVLREPAGQIEIDVTGPEARARHRLWLARGGSVRHSENEAGAAELALFPTSVLPGVVLRLCALAPVEPLAGEHRSTLSRSTVEELWSDQDAQRLRTWAALAEAARSLPPAAAPELEAAPPRAVRVSRRRSGGTRTAMLLLLRGRYLVVEETADGVVAVGTDPTGAMRRIMGVVVSRSG